MCSGSEKLSAFLWHLFESGPAAHLGIDWLNLIKLCFRGRARYTKDDDGVAGGAKGQKETQYLWNSDM